MWLVAIGALALMLFALGFSGNRSWPGDASQPPLAPHFVSTEAPVDAPPEWAAIADLDDSAELGGDESPWIEKRIEEMQPGDIVLAMNVETGELEPREVLDAFSRTTDHLRILEFESPDGTVQRIETTDEHPFWVPARSQYVNAGDLQTGNEVVSPSGELQKLIGTKRESHPEGFTVYNFEVEGHHNYFVASPDGTGPPVLVHNASCRTSASTVLARKLGTEGEAAAGIVKNTRHIESLSGKAKFRIPDELTARTLTEVKNVKYQHFSTQLRDSLHYSIMTERQMILKVRRSTRLSDDLRAAIESGWIRLEFIE